MSECNHPDWALSWKQRYDIADRELAREKEENARLRERVLAAIDFVRCSSGPTDPADDVWREACDSLETCVKSALATPTEEQNQMTDDERIGRTTALLQAFLSWHDGKFRPTPEQEERLIGDTRRVLAATPTEGARIEVTPEEFDTLKAAFSKPQKANAALKAAFASRPVTSGPQTPESSRVGKAED